MVDPAKYDFYAMDAYRLLGEDKLAETYAYGVIDSGTDFDGRERSPMRIAEARVTLGVTAARSGDVDKAVHYGRLALSGDRRSLPSLLMVSRELATIVRKRYADSPQVVSYLEELHSLSAA